jgi:hypothetical protein
MAEIKLLKIASGLETEHSSSADDLTMNQFTVDGGLVASSTGIDMNNGDISDANGLSFTDPTADGLTQTSGVLAADNIVGKERSNTFTTAGDILFPVVSDAAGELDAFRLPAIAGTPSATPTNGEGSMVWDSTNDILYVWDGSAWSDQSTVSGASQAGKLIKSGYIAATGGVAIRDVLYKNATANEVGVADASAIATMNVVGFAVAAATATNAVEVQSAGKMAGFTGLTVGAKQFVSETAGQIVETAPTTSGAVVMEVGIASQTTEIDIDIQEPRIRA